MLEIKISCDGPRCDAHIHMSAVPADGVLGFASRQGWSMGKDSTFCSLRCLDALEKLAPSALLVVTHIAKCDCGCALREYADDVTCPKCSSVAERRYARFHPRPRPLDPPSDVGLGEHFAKTGGAE